MYFVLATWFIRIQTQLLNTFLWPLLIAQLVSVCSDNNDSKLAPLSSAPTIGDRNVCGGRSVLALGIGEHHSRSQRCAGVQRVCRCIPAPGQAHKANAQLAVLPSCCARVTHKKFTRICRFQKKKECTDFLGTGLIPCRSVPTQTHPLWYTKSRVHPAAKKIWLRHLTLIYSTD